MNTVNIIATIQASSELPSIWDRTQRLLSNFGLPKWVQRQQKQANTKIVTKFESGPHPQKIFVIPEGLSAADYAKGVARADSTKKSIEAHLDLATLSNPTPKSTRTLILEFVEAEERVVTARDIWTAMQHIPYSSVSTRVSELSNSGFLRYTGKINRGGYLINAYVFGGK